MNDEFPSGRPPSYLRIILNNLKIWCRIKSYTRKFSEDQASEALVASTQEFAPCLDALVHYVAGMMLDACSCQRRFYDIITVFFDALNFLAKEKEEVRCENCKERGLLGNKSFWNQDGNQIELEAQQDPRFTDPEKPWVSIIARPRNLR